MKLKMAKNSQVSAGDVMTQADDRQASIGKCYVVREEL
jgi:hypothetical protein